MYYYIPPKGKKTKSNGKQRYNIQTGECKKIYNKKKKKLVAYKKSAFI